MSVRQDRSRGMVPAVLGGLLLAGLSMSAGRFWQAHSALENAQANLQECLNLARQIAVHRQRPAFLSEMPTSDSTVTMQINQAVQTTEISSANVTAIDPQPPQAIGDSGLRRQAAIIDFANVTVPQTVRFLDAVQQADPTWVASHLSFSAIGNRDSQQTATELWSVQVTLTRLSYSPITRDTP